MVEIGGDEIGVTIGKKPVGPVIEALAIDVHIVGIEHAVDEARADPIGAKPGRKRDHTLHQRRNRVCRRRKIRLIDLNHVARQVLNQIRPVKGSAPLEGAKSDRGVGAPHQHRTSGRRRLI